MITDNLVKIFKGTLRSVPKSQIIPITRYFQRIGILIDLESCEFDRRTMTQDEREISGQHIGEPIVSGYQRKHFMDGELLSNVQTYVCRCKKSAGREYPMMIGRGGIPDGERRLSIKKFVFAIDRMAVMIAIGDPVDDRTGKMTVLDPSRGHIKIPDHPSLSLEELNSNLSQYTTNLDGSVTIGY